MSRQYLMLSSDPAHRADPDRHARDVAQLTGLVEYDVRQRLIRPGVSLLGALEAEAAGRAASALSEAGYRATVIDRGRLSGVSRPQRVLGVRAEDGGIALLGGDGEPLAVVDATSEVLLVAGDLDAEPMAAVRARKRAPDPAVALKELSRGFPVLRIFDRGAARSFIVLGRRFNYTTLSGLGADATVSAAINFQTLVGRLQAAAGEAALDVDFRLSDLPPSRVQLVLDESHAGIEDFELHALLSQALWDEGVLKAPEGAAPAVDPPPERSEYAESAEAVSRVLDDPDRVRRRLWHVVNGVAPWWLLLAVVAGWLGSAVLLGLGEEAMLASLSLFAGAVPLRLGVIQLLRKREIEDYPTSRARSVAMGKVEVSGQARPAVPMRSPWGGLDCVWFRWTQLDRVTTADGKSQWQIVGRGDSGDLPFLVEDESGRVLVDPAGAEILVSNRNTIQGSYIRVIRGAPTAIPLGADTRIIEETVPAGRRLYVLGTARPVRRGGDGRVALRERLRALKADPDRLKTFDIDGDGRIDPEEWEAAVASVERELMSERLQAGEAGDVSPYGAVIGRGEEGCLFLIADRSEEALVRGIAARAWAYLLGGFAAVGFGVWGVLSF